MDHSLFNWSSIEEHLGYFQFWAIVDKAAMNMVYSFVLFVYLLLFS